MTREQFVACEIASGVYDKAIMDGWRRGNDTVTIAESLRAFVGERVREADVYNRMNTLRDLGRMRRMAA